MDLRLDKKWQGDERRTSPRFNVSVSISAATGESEECDALLSINGCFCTMRNVPPVGAELEVDVGLGGRQVPIRGRVIRILTEGEQAGVVVGFEELPFEVERTIARWLDSLCEKTHQGGSCDFEQNKALQ